MSQISWMKDAHFGTMLVKYFAKMKKVFVCDYFVTYSDAFSA